MFVSSLPLPFVPHVTKCPRRDWTPRNEITESPAPHVRPVRAARESLLRWQLKLDVEITLTPRQLAEAFCAMNDEQQAQVFVETASISSTWKTDLGGGWQWWSVGRHLATCDCSNRDAREIVREIARGAGDE